MFQKLLFILALVCVSTAAMAADKPVQLKGKDLEEAQQMNDIYARHMYSSSCVDRQKAFDTSDASTEAEKAGRMAEFKKSCDCMTDTVLKSFQPNDIISYVGDMNGAIPPGVTTRPKPDPIMVNKYLKIAEINRNKENREKCGLKQ